MLHHLREWIALSELPGIGPGLLLQLVQRTQSVPVELLNLSGYSLKALKLRPDTTRHIHAYQQGKWPDSEYLSGIETWLAQPGNHLISYACPDYPQLLKTIPDPPLLLYVSGDPGALHMPQLAIVGSRSASRNGVELSKSFASALTSAGMTITSGLARGVDGAAHRAAVELSRPTIAVLGSGLKKIYPRQHQKLADAIIEQGGALVSEYPLSMPPLAYNFPRRNRIISGLSAGVLVIEAAKRSGSLITARLALEQGREVFALPGALNNPQSHGCHDLIREGAILVETSAQIIEPLASLLGSYHYEERQADAESVRLTESETLLLDQIGYQLVTLEQLIGLTGQPASVLLPQLVGMELSGYIENTPDGYQRLI